MSAFSRILRRDIRMAARSGGNWAYGLVFMGLFLGLSAIALGGGMNSLQRIGVPLIWLGMTFAILISVDRAFSDDMEDGTIAQLYLSGMSFPTQAATKTVSFGLIYLLPLILTVPIWALLFALDKPTVIGLMLSLCCALPGLAGFTALAGAVTAAQSKGGFLAIFISGPLLIPLLIFGTAATYGYVDSGLATPALRVTLGLSLLSLAISIPASAAALKANLD